MSTQVVGNNYDHCYYVLNDEGLYSGVDFPNKQTYVDLYGTSGQKGDQCAVGVCRAHDNNCCSSGEYPAIQACYFLQSNIKRSTKAAMSEATQKECTGLPAQSMATLHDGQYHVIENSHPSFETIFGEKDKATKKSMIVSLGYANGDTTVPKGAPVEVGPQNRQL